MARPTDATIRAQEALLLDLLAQAPRGGQGISREGLGDAYARHGGARLPTRTLVRRLHVLVAAGRIEPVGQGPSTRYRLRSPALQTQVSDPARESVTKSADEPYVPLTPEGSAVRDLIRRPIMERKPVGYDRAWLESYRPGVDWLLTEAMRAELHTLGRTPDWSGRRARTPARA